MLARQRAAREKEEDGHQSLAAIARFLDAGSEEKPRAYADAAAQELAEKEGKETP
jgi:hypothetical protein